MREVENSRERERREEKRREERETRRDERRAVLMSLERVQQRGGSAVACFLPAAVPVLRVGRVGALRGAKGNRGTKSEGGKETVFFQISGIPVF